MKLTIIRLVVGCGLAVSLILFLFHGGGEEDRESLYNEVVGKVEFLRRAREVHSGTSPLGTEPGRYDVNQISFQKMEVTQGDFESFLRFIGQVPFAKRLEYLEHAESIVNREFRAIVISAILFADLSAEELDAALSFIDSRFYPGNMRTEILRHGIHELGKGGGSGILTLTRKLLTSQEIKSLAFELCPYFGYDEIAALRLDDSGDKAIEHLVQAKGVTISRKIGGFDEDRKRASIAEELRKFSASDPSENEEKVFISALSIESPFLVLDLISSNGFSSSEKVENEIFSRMIVQNPKKALKALTENDRLNSGTGVELFRSWIQDDIVSAASSFELLREQIAGNTSDEISREFAEFAIRKGDTTGALLWAEQIGDEEIRRKFIKDHGLIAPR